MENTDSLSSMQETPLISWHQSHHAKLVDFAGWLMPIQYTGVLDEYHAVRQAVGLFDVSHMGRIRVSGEQAEACLQSLTTNDVSRLEIGQAQYSMVCREDGGILDDIFVYKTDTDQFLVCANASNREKILHWFLAHQQSAFPQAVIQDVSGDLAQIAIQGPASPLLMRNLLGSDVDQLKPKRGCEVTANGWSGFLSRTGYTGELGYEWYLPAQEAPKAWEALMNIGVPVGVKPVGLGARDLLRLDVGYLLYGNDMDERISPLEAHAEWVVSWEKGEFLGRAALWEQHANSPSKQLVGFHMIERGIPRHDMTITRDAQPVGVVTSGNFSPVLQKGIGMGFLPLALGIEGTSIQIDIRGKLVEAQVVNVPFYKRPKR